MSQLRGQAQRWGEARPWEKGAANPPRPSLGTGTGHASGEGEQAARPGQTCIPKVGSPRGSILHRRGSVVTYN